MHILDLHLVTPALALEHTFYGTVLGFPTLSATPERVTLQAGASRLTLTQAADVVPGATTSPLTFRKTSWPAPNTGSASACRCCAMQPASTPSILRTGTRTVCTFTILPATWSSSLRATTSPTRVSDRSMQQAW